MRDPHRHDHPLMPSLDPVDALLTFVEPRKRLFVLTGAGISTASGIPDYRDEDGAWKRPPPVQFRDFTDHLETRKRYWARSLVGWAWFAQARPNVCHYALAEWEASGLITQLVTQNVDRLHQDAGSQQVIDLHGRLDQVICLDCAVRLDRVDFQRHLATLNPSFAGLSAALAPDGDAYLDAVDFSVFQVPACPQCGGILKPNVVFFGETVPRARVDHAIAALQEADALLVVGSSLMVYSGFRFCRLAVERGIPIVAINPGRTRADDLLALKVTARFEDLLASLHGRLPAPVRF